MKQGFYTKSEVARLYFPKITTESAVRNLRRWIDGCPNLKKALDETGYRKAQRYLSHQQMEIIYQYFGRP